MVKRTVGSGLFILGLLGVLGTAMGAPQNQPTDPTDRVVDQISSYGFFGMIMVIGVLLRRGGEPRPVLAPRRRDWDGQEPYLARAASAERRSRKDDWEPLGSDPEPGSRDTGSCAEVRLPAGGLRRRLLPVVRGPEPEPRRREPHRR